MKTIFLSSMILALALSLNSFAQKLPDAWPHTMKLEASYHGGMTQYSFTILITDSLSTMTELTQKGRKIYKKKFTQKELDTILAFLKTYRIDQIKSKMTPGITHDKGSESLTLSWDYNIVGASESASSMIEDAYKEDFDAIQGHVKGLFRKE